MNFFYSVAQQNGKIVKGRLSANSLEEARLTLQRDGIWIVSLKEERTKQKWWRLSLSKKLPLIKKMLFARQLATLLGSGVDLRQALNILANQGDDPQLVTLSQSVAQKISEGSTLARSLEKSPFIFDAEFLAMIRSGEETGHLVQVMEQLADEIEFQTKANQQMTSAIVYPLVLLGIGLLIVTAMMVYVLPQITGVFTESKITLPLVTRVLIAISDFLVSYGRLLLLFLLALGGAIFWRYRKNAKFRYRVAQWVLRLPLFGELILLHQLARWTRTLSSLLGSGVPAVHALFIALGVVGNEVLRELFERSLMLVREGTSIGNSLSDSPHIPYFVRQMIFSGEQSGQLPQLLQKTASYYQFLFASRTQAMLKLLEPILVVSMGGLVLFIVLAILLPVFELNNLV